MFCSKCSFHPRAPLLRLSCKTLVSVILTLAASFSVQQQWNREGVEVGKLSLKQVTMASSGM